VIRLLLIGILILLIARAFWKVIDGVIEAAGGTPRSRVKGRPQSPAMKLVRDPVCGTHVSPASAFTLAANGATHYFCSEACRERFGRTT
jgi:YHS domain-containing protein